jgi:hypothetical protein
MIALWWMFLAVLFVLLYGLTAFILASIACWRERVRRGKKSP